MPRTRFYGSLTQKPGYDPSVAQAPGDEAFHVTSTSFEKGAGAGTDSGTPGEDIIGRFKRQCTWDGPDQRRDVSPALSWHNAPGGTETFAITVVDIDAPDPEAPIAPFTHWVVANIPSHITALPEGFSGRSKGAVTAHGKMKKELDEAVDEIQEGVNDFKLPHYVGPNPPKGEHRYVITVYALDATMDLGKKVTREKLEEAMEGHVLAEAQIVGTYAKEKFCRGIEQEVRDHAIKEENLWGSHNRAKGT